MSRRVVSTVLALAAATFLAACGGSRTQPDNVASFEDALAGTPFKVEFQPQSEIHPGFVVGEATSKDGHSSSFAFSFGPAPEKLPPELIGNVGYSWFDQGDQVAYWFEQYPADVPPGESDRVLDMQFAIQDAACKVVADQKCGY